MGMHLVKVKNWARKSGVPYYVPVSPFSHRKNVHVSVL